MKKIMITLSILLAVVAMPVFAAEQTTRLAESQAQKQERLQEMTELKAKIAEVKTANQAAREALRLQSAEKAKTIAEKRLTNMIKVFTNIKNVVGQVPGLTDAERTEIKGTIDAEIMKLEAKKTEVAAATTVVEIKAVMTEAKVQAKTSMKTVKDLLKLKRSTRLHNVTKHLTEILTKLTTKAGAMTLTDPQKAELATIESSAKENIAKADAAIEAGNFTQAKLDAANAKTNLLAYVSKLKTFKAASAAK